MSRSVVVPYGEFTPKPVVRENRFLAREASSEQREFRFTLPNEGSPEEESIKGHESALLVTCTPGPKSICRSLAGGGTLPPVV